MDKIPSTFNFVPLLLLGKIGNNMVLNGVNILLRLISLYICFQVNIEVDIPSLIVAFVFPIVYIIYMWATRGGDYIVGLFGFESSEGESFRGEKCIERQGARDTDTKSGNRPSIPVDRQRCSSVKLGTDSTAQSCLSIKSVGSDEYGISGGGNACLYIPPDYGDIDTPSGIYSEHYSCGNKKTESECNSQRDDNNQKLCEWNSFVGKTCEWGSTKLGWVTPTNTDLDWAEGVPKLESHQRDHTNSQNCPAGCGFTGGTCSLSGGGLTPGKKVLQIENHSDEDKLTVSGLETDDIAATRLEIVKAPGKTCGLGVDSQPACALRTRESALNDTSGAGGCSWASTGDATTITENFGVGAGNVTANPTDDILTLESQTWTTITPGDGCELVVHGDPTSHPTCVDTNVCSGSSPITPTDQLDNSRPSAPRGYCEEK